MLLLAFQFWFSNHFQDSVSDPKSSRSISFLPQRRLLLLETKSVRHTSSSIYFGTPSPHLFSLSLDVPSSWKPSSSSQAGSAARYGLPHPSPAHSGSPLWGDRSASQEGSDHCLMLSIVQPGAGHRAGAQGMLTALNLMEGGFPQ